MLTATWGATRVDGFTDVPHVFRNVPLVRRRKTPNQGLTCGLSRPMGQITTEVTHRRFPREFPGGEPSPGASPRVWCPDLASPMGQRLSEFDRRELRAALALMLRGSPSAGKPRLETLSISAQPLVQLECGSECVAAQRALPDDCDTQAGIKQAAPSAPIALHVRVELRLPEFLSSGRRRRVRATCMSVPEAAVDEAHGSESSKHQIRGAGKLAVVQAESETARMESPTEDEFG